VSGGRPLRAPSTSKGLEKRLSDPTVISIDAMGGDFGPPVIVAGLAGEVEAWRAKGVRFLLHGDQTQIEAELARKPAARDLCEVLHADKVIASDEKPAQAVRRGKGSSMWNAIEAIRDGKAQAAVSAGNSGALMAVSKLILRMAADLDRPAFVVSWPSTHGTTSVLDVGANIDCDAGRLVEFAIMGAAFHRALTGKEAPSVGLLNVGEEEQKGHEEVREANQLLREGNFVADYRGFVEGTDLSSGVVDVVVTDGFTGNVALKTAEGTARFVSNELRGAFSASPLGRLGAFIAQSSLRRFRARMQPDAGGPLLGLNGIVVKSHGGADARGFASAVRVAVDLAQSDYVSEIRRNLENLTAVLAEQSKATPAENTG
jgi:glycerol-3-phosphate acyltransferase PlsX